MRPWLTAASLSQRRCALIPSSPLMNFSRSGTSSRPISFGAEDRAHPGHPAVCWSNHSISSNLRYCESLADLDLVFFDRAKLHKHFE
jgi:hypothetical protein